MGAGGYHTAGALGLVSFGVAQDDVDAAEDEQPGPAMRIDLARPAVLTGMTAACHGGATILVAYGIGSDDVWLASSSEIACDEEFHSIEIEADGVTVLEFAGHGADTHAIVVAESA